jgi:hypothetical protein
VKDHVKAGQGAANGGYSGHDQHPPVSDANGDTGRAEGTEHRQDVNRERIVPTLHGHRCEVSHAHGVVRRRQL